MPQIAANLRAARAAAGLTQEQLARALDVGVRTVQGWELSETEPRGRNLAAVGLLLGHERAWFYASHGDDENGVAA